MAKRLNGWDGVRGALWRATRQRVESPGRVIK